MDSLKRSQKLCAKCNEKNPIRSFKCRKCGYGFPQKQKKEITSNQQSQLEQFLTKKTKMPMDQFLIDHSKAKAKTDPNIKSNKEDQIQSNLFSLIKVFYPTCHFTQLNNTHIDEDDNKPSLIEITESINRAGLQIKLNDSSQCVKFSFDCLATMTNSICLIGFISKEITKVYYSLIYLRKLSVIEKHIFSYSNPSLIATEETSYYSVLVKLITTAPFDIFMIVIGTTAFCVCFNETTNDQLQLFSVTKRFAITKLDTHYDSKKNTIKLLLCDANNQMFYYTFTIAETGKSHLKLLGVFDNHFQSKITDMKFLNIRDEIAAHMTYFAACSRDGVVKIIDVNNVTLFKHKTYQTWITQLFFDFKNEILFFLTNYDDKIVGVKLSNRKEPIIKRVINTNNPQCGLVSDIDDKLYYMDYTGSVFEVKTFLIEDMFKTSKSKKKTEYEPKQISQLSNWEFTKAIKVLNLYDNETNMCLIVYDQLDSLCFTLIEAK